MITMTKTRGFQIGVLGALVLALAVAAWLAASQFSGSSPAIAAELAQTIQQNKQSLLEGIRARKPLYYKVENYTANPVGPGGPGAYPHRTVEENWLVAGPDGRVEAVVATKRNLQGDLLGYTVLKNEVQVYTDIATGETLEIPLDDAPLADAFGAFWDGLQVQEAGTEFKGRGTLNTRTSLVYELSVPAVESYVKIEIVEDTPLLYRESIYEGNNADPSRLMRQSWIVEYRLLPIGSALPDPAAEAAARR